MKALVNRKSSSCLRKVNAEKNNIQFQANIQLEK
jgi:hypothetical protein